MISKFEMEVFLVKSLNDHGLVIGLGMFLPAVSQSCVVQKCPPKMPPVKSL